VLNFDAGRRLVGVDIDQTSQIVELTQLEAKLLPAEKFSQAQP